LFPSVALKIIFIYTNWLFTRSKILQEKLPVAQLVKELTAFHGTQRFVAVFTAAHNWIWAYSHFNPVQIIMGARGSVVG
jgi:hypothetical protein